MAETKNLFGGDITKMMPAGIYLEGDSDDYLQVDASGDAMNDNDTRGALMAWVMMADDTSTMTAIGYGDKSVVEFIELNVEAGYLTCRCTDNTTAQFVTQADGDKLEKHKWYHIAVVQRADGTGPHLFINGKEIASTNDTATNINAWFKACAGIDSGRIGAANKAGDDTVTQEWHGFIGPVRIYDDTELKTDAMIKNIFDYENARVFENPTHNAISNDTTGLLNHWDMTDLVDAGSGADNATIVGGVLLGSGCCTFTSRLWFDGPIPLVADKLVIAMNETKGLAVHLDAA